jgi:hypothetical protein
MRTAVLKEKVTAPAWGSKPVWYLLTDHDRMIDPRVQREFVFGTTRELRAPC